MGQQEEAWVHELMQLAAAPDPPDPFGSQEPEAAGPSGLAGPDCSIDRLNSAAASFIAEIAGELLICLGTGAPSLESAVCYAVLTTSHGMSWEQLAQRADWLRQALVVQTGWFFPDSAAPGSARYLEIMADLFDTLARASAVRRASSSSST